MAVKPSVKHFWIFSCKIWDTRPGKTSKPLDANVRSSVLLQSLSYEKSCITLQADQTVERTRTCLVEKDFSFLKQWQNNVRVFSSMFEDTLSNYCNRAAVH